MPCQSCGRSGHNTVKCPERAENTENWKYGTGSFVTGAIAGAGAYVPGAGFAAGYLAEKAADYYQRTDAQKQYAARQNR
jgi:hypothetical protein